MLHILKNKTVVLLLVVALLVIVFFLINMNTSENKEVTVGLDKSMTQTDESTTQANPDPVVHPVEHASFVLEWGSEVIYFDPVGDVADYAAYKAPTAIFITDIHGDHYNKDIIGSLLKDGVDLIVPEAVKELLPTDLAMRASVMANDGVLTVRDMTVTATPMYNLPGESEKFHTKGRGNGYILERNGVRIYNAGDTAGTPEIKSLTNISIAFIPMNLPYTMDVAAAAEAVLAFAPKTVYPFHYRGQGGLSDVQKFKELVTASNPNITVELANWYPNGAE